MTRTLPARLLAAALLATPAAAAATTVDFVFRNGAATVASGSFSFDDSLTGVIGYGDLDSFSIDFLGATYDLAEVLPLTNYQYLAYDIAANTLISADVFGNVGGPFNSVMSAINDSFSSGFFFNLQAGAATEYAQGNSDTPISELTLTVRDVTEVPAPAAALLFGAGLLGLAFARRRG